jgi:hypothetical protein
MEDSWTTAGSAFGSPEDPSWFSALGPTSGWHPAVLLNGSSVTDGCRVLVTNVADLPSGQDECEPTGSGVVPGSLDALANLHSALGNDGDPCTFDGRGDLRLITAAMLAARFPVVSSSGVFDRCVTRKEGSGSTSSCARSPPGRSRRWRPWSGIATWRPGTQARWPSWRRPSAPP